MSFSEESGPIISTGTYHSPDLTWNITTDLKHRKGLIRKLTSNATCPVDDNGTVIFTLG